MASYSGSVAASADDADEGTSGTVDITGGAMTLTAANQYFGFRFQGVGIPAGSTIDAATIDVYLLSGSFDDPNLDIYGEDVDDAAGFSASSYNISGRALTTAVTGWSATGIGTGVKTSPDFKGVVQEIVDRAGWNSGQDMVIIMAGKAGSAFRVRTYDAGGGSYGTLKVTYTEPSGGAIVPLVVHHFRQQGIG